jgi:predicted HTH domain antitoxin
MKPVTVEFPDEVFAAARRSPSEVARDMRYEQGMISQGMAARIADLSRADFMKAISERGVSPFQESIADVRDALDE